MKSRTKDVGRIEYDKVPPNLALVLLHEVPSGAFSQCFASTIFAGGTRITSFFFNLLDRRVVPIVLAEYPGIGVGRDDSSSGGGDYDAFDGGAVLQSALKDGESPFHGRGDQLVGIVCIQVEWGCRVCDGVDTFDGFVERVFLRGRSTFKQPPLFTCKKRTLVISSTTTTSSLSPYALKVSVRCFVLASDLTVPRTEYPLSKNDFTTQTAM